MDLPNEKVFAPESFGLGEELAVPPDGAKGESEVEGLSKGLLAGLPNWNSGLSLAATAGDGPGVD